MNDQDLRDLDDIAIVCLCGSTRFYEQFQQANYELTMQGKIVLSVGFYPHATIQAHGENIGCTDEQKAKLDRLHLSKIDLADEIFVINVDGYVGQSTMSEIAYALFKERDIRWLEEPEGGTEDWVFQNRHALGEALARHYKNREFAGEGFDPAFDDYDPVGYKQEFEELLKSQDLPVVWRRRVAMMTADDWRERFIEARYEPQSGSDDEDDDTSSAVDEAVAVARKWRQRAIDAGYGPDEDDPDYEGDDYDDPDITTVEGVREIMGMFQGTDYAQRLADHHKVLSKFVMRVQEKMADMDDAVRRTYRKKVADLADDLIHLLGVSTADLGEVYEDMEVDQRRAIVLQLFLSFSDDDDDEDDEVEPELEPDGEKVRA